MTTRIRYLKPDFFLDEDVADLEPLVRLFYAGLWTRADRSGRLEDRPERLKVEIIPYDKFDAEDALTQLAKQKRVSGRPFIQRYEVDGRRYIQILSWERYQKPHHSEKKSMIPAPPNGYITVKDPLSNGDSPPETGTGIGIGIEKGTGTEMGKGTGTEKGERGKRKTVGKPMLAEDEEKSGGRLPPSVGRSAPPSDEDFTKGGTGEKAFRELQEKYGRKDGR